MMSWILQPVASLLFKITGFTIQTDQLSFFVALYLSLTSSYIFKHKLQKSNIPLRFQFYFIGTLGLCICSFVWGRYVLLPVFEAMVSYGMMLMLGPKASVKYIFIFAMGFLSACHMTIAYTRLMRDSSADYTGPVMIMTQRITSLSFSLSDGLTRREDELNDDQKRHAVRKIPSFSEYFAYMFSFFGIMAGPFVFYNDFMKCIKTKHHYTDKTNDMKPSSVIPSSSRAVFSKVIISMFMICVYWIGSKSFHHHKNIDQTYMDATPIWERILYLYVSLLVFRTKYYGAWLFSDAIHNAAGIGFNGYNGDGSPRWDKISNINIPQIEFGTGLKLYIDNWNITTVRWIRMVSYDRLSPKYRTIASFLLSAFWHGFFPGYYIMFLTCHIFLLVQRKVRRVLRPVFQKTRTRHHLYEIATFFITQLSIAYGVLPFVILEWSGCIRFYKSVWFAGHIIGLALLLFVPNQRSQKTTDSVATEKLDAGAKQTNGAKNMLAANFHNGSTQNGHSHVRQR